VAPSRAFPLVAAIVGLVAHPAAATPTPVLLEQFCGGCHFEGAAEGGVALDKLVAAQTATPRPAANSPDHLAWVNAWKNLLAETMPPADEPQPTVEQRRELVAFVSRDVLGVDPGRPDPGRVVLRRLNRVEYANSVRDLTGIEQDLLDDLPADDTGYGFDTIGEVLSLSPMLLEKYLELAADVAARVLAGAADRRGLEYPAAVQRLFPLGPPPDDPAAHAEHLRTTLRRLAERGFRRPVDDANVSRLVAVATKAMESPGGSFEAGVAAAVTAVLASPRFLFRLEEPASAEVAIASRAVPIDEFALATRLSYFLWSTLPDDELFELARSGRLRAELARQVERLIQDPRADAFVENFVGQWLQTRDVEALPFDIAKVLGLADRRVGEQIFSPAVRRGMRLETELLFAHVLRSGLPATDLLVGRETFLNEPLARFYGIPDVAGDAMRLVDVPPESPRGGLLSHGSFLVVTSNPTRTSPVKRGLFILDNVLGTPAPPAPADVPALERSESSLGAAATMRQLMELHRSDALCASCHKRMDPLGLALERYNAVGQYRDDDPAAPLDTSGRLITGETFADARELAAVIAGPRRRDFHRCLTEKLLTYALGRGVEYFDAPAVDTILEQMEGDGRLLTLVQGVVESVPFQMRRPDPPPSQPTAPPPDRQTRP
jgi:hypothetical protein